MGEQTPSEQLSCLLDPSYNVACTENTQNPNLLHDLARDLQYFQDEQPPRSTNISERLRTLSTIHHHHHNNKTQQPPSSFVAHQTQRKPLVFVRSGAGGGDDNIGERIGRANNALHTKSHTTTSLPVPGGRWPAFRDPSTKKKLRSVNRQLLKHTTLTWVSIELAITSSPSKRDTSWAITTGSHPFTLFCTQTNRNNTFESRSDSILKQKKHYPPLTGEDAATPLSHIFPRLKSRVVSGLLYTHRRQLTRQLLISLHFPTSFLINDNPYQIH